MEKSALRGGNFRHSQNGAGTDDGAVFRQKKLSGDDIKRKRGVLV
jgi:hypothetical protein